MIYIVQIFALVALWFGAKWLVYDYGISWLQFAAIMAAIFAAAFALDRYCPPPFPDKPRRRP
jgi:hypothetical protein